MCLAIPVQVSEILEGGLAMATVGGIQRQINIALVEGLEVGDYVILHVGYALTRIDVEEAERTLALMAAGDTPDAGRLQHEVMP